MPRDAVVARKKREKGGTHCGLREPTHLGLGKGEKKGKDFRRSEGQNYRAPTWAEFFAITATRQEKRTSQTGVG